MAGPHYDLYVDLTAHTKTRPVSPLASSHELRVLPLADTYLA
jgi:hypothetical protein